MNNESTFYITEKCSKYLLKKSSSFELLEPFFKRKNALEFCDMVDEHCTRHDHSKI